MKRFTWTFTLRSYNYLLHTLTPHKLKDFLLSVLYSVSWMLLSNSFSCCILSVRSVSVSVFFTHSLLCTRSVLYCSVLADESSLQPFSNPLKVALGVPSRGHSVEQFIFLLSFKRLASYCENKGLPSRWLAMDVYSWRLGTCLSRVAQQLTVPAGCHVNMSQQFVT
jgi:hypothetical protein